MANFPKNYNFDALATLLNKRASYVRILSVDCKSYDDLLRSINIAGILEGIPPTMFGATYVSEAHAEADSLHGEKNAFRGDEDGHKKFQLSPDDSETHDARLRASMPEP